MSSSMDFVRAGIKKCVDNGWEESNINPDRYRDKFGIIIPVNHTDKESFQTGWTSLRKTKENGVFKIDNIMTINYPINNFLLRGVATITGEETGFMVIEDIKEELKYIFKDTLMSVSPSGTYHAFYKWEKEFGNIKENDTTNGIAIRSNNLQVCLPPTLYPNMESRIWVNNNPIQEMTEDIKNYLKSIIKVKPVRNYQNNNLEDNYNFELGGNHGGDNYIAKAIGTDIRSYGNDSEAVDFIYQKINNSDNFQNETSESTKKRLHKEIQRIALRDKYLKGDMPFINQDQNVQTEVNGIKEKEILDNNIIPLKSDYSSISSDLNRIVLFTKYKDINKYISLLRTNRLYTFYGLPNCGKSSLAKKILEDNPNHSNIYIQLENTLNTLEETEFDQWVYTEGRYTLTNNYTETYLFSHAFNEDIKISKEDYERNLNDFLLHKKDKVIINNYTLNKRTGEHIKKAILQKEKEARELGKSLMVVVDSTTLVDNDSENKTYTECIMNLLILLNNKDVKSNCCIILIAHATRGDNKHKDLPYGSSHYLNFCDGVFEIRESKLIYPDYNTESGWVTIIPKKSMEIEVHKNRPHGKGQVIKYEYYLDTGIMNRFTREITKQEVSEESDKPKKRSRTNH